MRTHAAFLCLFAAACGGSPDRLSTEELMKPEACKDCHPVHFRQWSGSMHAYAADDPVFLAMNARGQRETGGELGDFCVGCHAPMAVRTGATTDGLNLAEVPQHLKGVTCYFCHTAVEVTGTHNNPLILADDGRMRGGITDPVPTDAHRTAYSPLHDRTSRESSKLCGSCHDIVTDKNVHLERSFAEWQQSVFASDDPRSHLSCSQCHMPGDRPGVAADVDGVPLRSPHDHSFPAVDIALTPWPQQEEQRALVQAELDGTLIPELCVAPQGAGVRIEYTLDNAFAGHKFPSGASHDRRAWAEVIAQTGGVDIFTTGVVPEGTAVSTHAETDPDLWQIRDFAYDDSGKIAHMFWDVARVESQTLPTATTNDPSDPAFYHAVTRAWNVDQVPDRIEAVVHIRPVGLDILDDLIDSGDLDPAIRARMPTFTLTTTRLVWTMADGFGCIEP